MAISMYQASVPTLLNMLRNLRLILQKAAAHAEARKFDAAALVNGRLFPDMFTLARQVQIATDMAKFCVARLAAVEAPKYEDNEATIPELIARVDKTIDYVKTFEPVKIDGTEDRDVVLKSPRGELKFKGQQYLIHFVLPNFYFHIVTAYNILRHNGVELGKQDFLGSI